MNKVYKHFLKNYVFTQKKYFVLVCFITVLQSVVSMCIPLTSRELLDNAFPNRNMQLFTTMVIVMLSCYFMVAVLNVLKDYLLAHIAESISLKLRTQLNSKISVMKYSYFDKHNLSEVLSKYNKEVDTVKENCGYMLVKTLSNVVTFILASAMIIILDWRIMVVSMALLFLYILNNRYWGKKVKALAEKSMECNEEAIGSLTENYRNVLITKLYSAYEYVNEKFHANYTKQYNTQMNLEVVYSVNINSGGLLIYLLADLIWLIGGFGIINGVLTIGTVTALINYQGMLISPMAFFSEFNNSYQGTVIALKRLYSVLCFEEENNEGTVIRSNNIEKVDFHDVSFRYRKDVPVLDNVNIQLRKGTIVGFIGGSGCGKSSLVKMLLRLYAPYKGTISIDGEKIQDISINSLRNRIAFVAQDSLFFRGSILENLKMGNVVDNTKLIEYSKLLDLYDEIVCLPKKWDTELNAGTSNLSGGQKKRLDVLRALMKESDIIIFDESTASIDIERRKRLFEILDKIKQEKIIIFITHNIEECVYCDQIYAVKNRSVQQISYKNLSEAYS
ncbi:ABC transporter ATP-binding protein [Coprococcus comes]|jgi:ABC-type bacteriocin/lantibiotic exporter with double-glycine peptidase domain|uniref:ABC transporter ATP-binding protein n=3 Tax=Lachnospiraceae TaxID=186803 RepID=A0A3E4GTM7_9FIRM|nr:MULTISPECIES: ABC transporter ATP-binding protein [Lachnospiraceae]RHP73821.1 ABC transporter ATP-binding protein [Ruminococcus sp. OF02-6]RHU06494.1 ABC transporter ATP-binding protein [Ruminococcus sp. AM27-16]RJW22316.1 ABC transporter ATP-binding protein [Lachnospiraceae bacterium TM07-2AC]MDB8698992.1 ABC transporter ATP-binding protein [Mediterraneibacter gnavus]RGJ26266.1 ABC transporter ATP-binding protein [Coprococcus comes]